MFPSVRFHLEIVQECGSSQEVLLARRGDSSFHGLAVLALRQTAGYGRRGRSWDSQEGNLALSFGLEIPAGLACLPLIPFATGLAAYRVAKALLPASADLRLKWPNDLYLNGAKLGGLIAQARQVPGERTEVGVGIGVNLAQAPENVGQPAIALASLIAAPKPEAFASSLLTELADLFANTPTFAELRSEWERAARLGEDPLWVVGEEPPVMGLALLATGELLVRGQDGIERKLASEEVSLRFTKPPLNPSPET